MSIEPDLKIPPPPEPRAPGPITRRRVLGLLGMVGAGLAAVPAAELLRPYLSRLESHKWAKRSSVSSPVRTFTLVDTENYTAFLKAQNLQHLTISKILASHAKERSGVRNALPPPHLWSNLVPTLRVAEMLGEYLGENVKLVVSAYRTNSYNLMCPGSAKNSQHVSNNALDLVFKSPPSQVAKAARELRSRGLFKGGVGLYSSFVHVDTRGRNSDW